MNPAGAAGGVSEESVGVRWLLEFSQLIGVAHSPGFCDFPCSLVCGNQDAPGPCTADPSLTKNDPEGTSHRNTFA